MFLRYFSVTNSSVFCFLFFLLLKCSPKLGCALYTGTHYTGVNTVCPHRRSSWNSEFKRMEWFRRWKQHRRSTIHWRNVCPDQTTFAAWCKWPIRDSNWAWEDHRRWLQEVISSLKAANFSSGRCAYCSTESNSIPRMTSQVDGPTHLPGCRGRPNFWQTDKAVCRLEAHWVELGDPVVIKSLK